MKARFFTLFATVLLVSSNAVLAEDLSAVLGRVNQFVAAGNYPKALDELAWARTEIEKLQAGKVKTFFPDTLAGFTGQKESTSNALGFSNFERVYKKDSSAVKISLTGGSSAGGNAGFGNLAALGRMAAMMGQQPGQETVRISGRTATLTGTDGGSNPELTIFLDSGSLLKLESEESANGEILKSLAEALKIDDLDAFLRGSAK